MERAGEDAGGSEMGAEEGREGIEEEPEGIDEAGGRVSAVDQKTLMKRLPRTASTERRARRASW